MGGVNMAPVTNIERRDSNGPIFTEKNDSELRMFQPSNKNSIRGLTPRPWISVKNRGLVAQAVTLWENYF